MIQRYKLKLIMTDKTVATIDVTANSYKDAVKRIENCNELKDLFKGKEIDFIKILNQEYLTNIPVDPNKYTIEPCSNENEFLITDKINLMSVKFLKNKYDLDKKTYYLGEKELSKKEKKEILKGIDLYAYNYQKEICLPEDF